MFKLPNGDTSRDDKFYNDSITFKGREFNNNNNNNLPDFSLDIFKESEWKIVISIPVSPLLNITILETPRSKSKWHYIKLPWNPITFMILEVLIFAAEANDGYEPITHLSVDYLKGFQRTQTFNIRIPNQVRLFGIYTVDLDPRSWFNIAGSEDNTDDGKGVGFLFLVGYMFIVGILLLLLLILPIKVRGFGGLWTIVFNYVSNVRKQQWFINEFEEVNINIQENADAIKRKLDRILEVLKVDPNLQKVILKLIAMAGIL